MAGAFLVTPEKRSDDRGFFARTWCADEFRARGLVHQFAQSSLSVNPIRGTLRGLHFQRAPHAEVKLLRCVRGAIFDVIVDIRPDSSTYLQWIGVELGAGSFQSLYAPQGFAHGFQTLMADTEVDYLISTPYAPGAADGLRYDDTTLAIDWPVPVTRVSDRDLDWPLLDAISEERAAAPAGSPMRWGLSGV